MMEIENFILKLLLKTISKSRLVDWTLSALYGTNLCNPKAYYIVIVIIILSWENTSSQTW